MRSVTWLARNLAAFNLIGQPVHEILGPGDLVEGDEFVGFVGDGDVAGVIAVTDEDTTIDMYMGQGGAPEGVLAAAALRCVGGQFNGRLVFRNEDEKARAAKWGIEDLDRIYKLEDLAKGDCIFAATGVTSGSLLEGVKRRKGGRMTTESVVMRASSGTVRWIRGEHRVR